MREGKKFYVLLLQVSSPQGKTRDPSHPVFPPCPLPLHFPEFAGWMRWMRSYAGCKVSNAKCRVTELKSPATNLHMIGLIRIGCMSFFLLVFKKFGRSRQIREGLTGFNSLLKGWNATVNVTQLGIKIVTKPEPGNQMSNWTA